MDIASSEHHQASGTIDHYRVSVPGRTELAGNHQDHQGGCVIAAGINRRISCDARPHSGSCIHVRSEGHEECLINLADPNCWTSRASERHTTISLVRGMAAQLMQQGVELHGCILDIRSDIPAGAGLSSSAAFELCVGAALAVLGGWKISLHGSTAAGNVDYDSRCLTPLHLAQMALHAERAFFGKPCGIMDQIACAYGGVIQMDFANRVNPVVSHVVLPPSCDAYTYLLVNCGSGHEDSTDAFAQVAQDMQAAADVFGVAELRDVGMTRYVDNIGRVRAQCGDLVALRGLAFFEEFALVHHRLDALHDDNARQFVYLTNRSSVVSAQHLQNVGFPGRHEDAMVALALCHRVLAELTGARDGTLCGSARIHGGGFGGTIQVIVPNEFVQMFTARIDSLLGAGSCMLVRLGAPGIRVEEPGK